MPKWSASIPPTCRFCYTLLVSTVAIPGVRLKTTSPLDRTAEVLAALVTSTSTWRQTRQDAIHHIGELNTPIASATLRSALEDKDDRVRLASAVMLINIGYAPALALAEEVLNRKGLDPSDYIVGNMRAVLGSGSHRDEAIPALSRLARNDDVLTRRAAVRDWEP